MDKRQLLWIMLLGLALALLLRSFFTSKKPQQEPATTAAASQPGAVADEQTSWNYGGSGISQDKFQADELKHPLLGSLDQADEYNFQVELDARGGGVYTVKLAGCFDTVAHKRMKGKTPQQLQDWSYPILNPVVGGTRMVLPFSTQYLRIEGQPDVPTFASPLVPLAWDKQQAKPARGRILWQAGDGRTAGNGTQTIDFTLELYAAAEDPQPHYRLVKTYALAKNSDILKVLLRLENLTDEPQRLSVVQYGPAGVPREGYRDDFRDVLSGQCITQEDKIVVEKVVKRKKMKDEQVGREDALGDNQSNNDKPVVWAGQTNKFFAVLARPVSESVDATRVDQSTSAKSLVVPAAQYTYAVQSRVIRESPESKTQMVVFMLDAKSVEPGESRTFEFEVYCGPKSRSTFKDTPLYDKLNYAGAIQFHSCQWCLVDALAWGVMWLIETGGKAIGNYGMIVILMVLAIRLVLHPITKKSQVSMMKMQKLGPEMQKIKDKHKDDKQAQQKAMMTFMKTQGASPFLGCLPMLLQMPIWIALWAGLQASVSLRHEGLLPFWITDLAGPDTVISWTPFTLPMIGPVMGLNLLPLLLTVFMFLQQKLTPMQSTATASPDQRKQQKMMMYMMSIMMMLIFYNAPSGLTLYIMASTAAGVLESYVIRKHIRQKEALQTAMETKVAIPGRVQRGQRPKKPKGPFKY